MSALELNFQTMVLQKKRCPFTYVAAFPGIDSKQCARMQNHEKREDVFKPTES